MWCQMTFPTTPDHQFVFNQLSAIRHARCYVVTPLEASDPKSAFGWHLKGIGESDVRDFAQCLRRSICNSSEIIQEKRVADPTPSPRSLAIGVKFPSPARHVRPDASDWNMVLGHHFGNCEALWESAVATNLLSLTVYAIIHVCELLVACFRYATSAVFVNWELSDAERVRFLQLGLSL